MQITFHAWLLAFVLTQLVEAPVYLAGTRRHPLGRRLVIALGASTLTHPLLWWALPWEGSASPWLLAVGGEVGVVAIETLWCAAWKVAHPLRLAVLTNAASLLAGLVFQALGL